MTAEPSNIRHGHPLATWLQRLIAHVIDRVLVVVLVALFGLAVGVAGALYKRDAAPSVPLGLEAQGLGRRPLPDVYRDEGEVVQLSLGVERGRQMPQVRALEVSGAERFGGLLR